MTFAEHDGQELAATLSVAVLSGERSAVRGDQAGGTLQETPVLDHAVRVREPKGNTRVHATLAEVPIQGRAGVARVPKLLEERLEVAEIVAEARGRDGGVLPALPRVGVTGHVRGCTEAALAYPPELVFLLGILQEGNRGIVIRLCERAQQAFGSGIDLGPRVPAELHHQEGIARGKLLEGDQIRAA